MGYTKTCLNVNCPERTGGPCLAGTDPQLIEAIMDIIKAPAESEFSTSDIAVGMMSSTTLHEKAVKIASAISENSSISYAVGNVDGKIEELHSFLDAVKAGADPYDYVADRIANLRELNNSLKKRVGIES